MSEGSGGPQGRRRCPVCAQILNERYCPTDAIATLLIDTPHCDPAQIKPGAVIGERYRIERTLGSGGQSTVFEARHTGTGRAVALKVLSPANTDDKGVMRFFQEARVTSGLMHPNTIRVFDFGQDDAGYLYLAMEILTGRTLRAELRDRLNHGSVLSEAEALAIAVGVTKSLGEAHAAGLVHRDLKPENLFLHSVPSDETLVKVLDFGIAKSLGAQLTGSQGVLIGTPAYMSPEQAQSLPIDGRSDLYSLGVVLFELVSGVPPFVADSPLQTLFLHVRTAAPPLEERARTAVSPRFSAIVARLLEKDPAKRFQDAVALRLALQEAQASIPTLVTPKKTMGPVPRAPLALLGGVFAFAAALIVVVALFQANERPEAVPVVYAPRPDVAMARPGETKPRGPDLAERSGEGAISGAAHGEPRSSADPAMGPMKGSTPEDERGRPSTVSGSAPGSARDLLSPASGAAQGSARDRALPAGGAAQGSARDRALPAGGAAQGSARDRATPANGAAQGSARDRATPASGAPQGSARGLLSPASGVAQGSAGERPPSKSASPSNHAAATDRAHGTGYPPHAKDDRPPSATKTATRARALIHERDPFPRTGDRR